jgi:hypothetical protein
LRDDDTPGPSAFSWTGELAMEPEGEAVEVTAPQGSSTRFSPGFSSGGGRASSF